MTTNDVPADTGEVADLIAEAQREAAQAVLDAVRSTRTDYVAAARAAAARYGAGTAAGGDGR